VKDFPVDTSAVTWQHRSAAVRSRNEIYPLSRPATLQPVDPVVQRERFQAQVTLIAAGDEEAMPLDEDFGDYDGVWNAAEWRQRNGDRPAAHHAHQFGYRDHRRFRWYDHNGWVD
jgi:hypothetical protein